MHIMVLGVGQSLRGDDAAGLEAVRLWQAHHLESARRVHVELNELPGLALLDRLEGMHAAIIVDALHTDAEPGSLLTLRPDDLAAFSAGAGSAHGWGVAETLELGLRLYPSLANCRIILIGIAGSQFTVGASLSPAVLAGLGQAAALIEKEVNALL